MTDEPKPTTEAEVDAYLDGLMQPEEKEAFEARLRAHPEVRRELQLQAEVDTSLKRLFPLAQVPESQLIELKKSITLAMQTETGSQSSSLEVLPRHSLSRRVQAALVGLAAVLAWILVVWQEGNNSTNSIFFEAKPVASVYQEVLDSGFEPYYECHEEDRFAATFLRRQGQALRLTELPAGSRMLGLSYPGGLSRDTTAMLCRVDEQPIMVFVDRLESDSPLAKENDSSAINVFREARDGLVLYEVTPFDEPRMIEHLVPLQESE